VLDNVFLEPFPHKDSHRLMTIEIHDTDRSDPGGRGGFTTSEFSDYAEQSRVFDGVSDDSNADPLYTSNEGTEGFINRALGHCPFVITARHTARSGCPGRRTLRQ
jgi:hypothetical protein